MDRVITQYKKRSEATSPLSPPHVLAQRTRARQQFSEEGFPTQKAEDWKYTSLRRLESTYFEPHAAPSNEITRRFSPHLLDDAFTLCFYNGYYCAGASTTPALPQGVIITPMSQALAQHGTLLEQHYGQLLHSASPTMVPFNEMLWQEGLLIFVPEGITVEPIIQLLYINDSATAPCSSHFHHLFLLGANAQATLIEEHCYTAPPTEKSLSTQVSEIHCGENSHFTHTRLQNNHHQHTLLTHTYVQQKKHSHYHHHSYDVGSVLNRNDLTIQLQEPQARCHLQGLYHVNQQQHMDNHIDIHHDAPHTSSTQNYRGILEDRGRAVFNGAVTVAQGAFKAYAEQYNHNLLLSDKAEIDTKPQLEIYADDVKCSHGATVGQMDEQALFYLQSRGIPETLARQTLIAGFAHTTIEEQPLVSIRNKATHALREKFPHEILGITS